MTPTLRSLLITFVSTISAASAWGDGPTTRPATKPATAPSSRPAAMNWKPSTRPAAPAGFATVESAVVGKIKAAVSATAAQPGYLGIAVVASDGKTIIDHVDPDSPASQAGLVVGDRLVSINSVEVSNRPSAVAETLLGLNAGEPIKLSVLREGQPRELTAQLAPVSRPMKVSGVRAVMGIQLRDSMDGDGAVIAQVTRDLPADKAGIKAGDVIIRIDDAAVGAMTSINELLASYAPDDTIKVRYRRDGKLTDIQVKLTADARAGADIRSFSSSSVFRKDVFKLAIIGIEYPDAKRSETIKPKDWEDSFFSTGTYTDKSATGQQVFGSMNDYFAEVSCGKLRVEGKMFDWVQVAKNRMDYGQGSGDPRLLNEAIDKLQERDGKDSLRGYDGLLFLYAGGRMQTNRGNIYWPHKGLMIHQGRRWPMFICPEGGDKMANISTFTHEFGHMLGLPDLYARPENPGSEGLGQWCLMSNQLGNGKPQHMSAWCKEQLGWLRPTVIDPTVKQKLVLSPIEGSTNECFKILSRADGSEYYLLEVRKKVGWDIDLPGEGLLIWRVVRGRPILEESHGVEGPLGPRSFLRSVPFPSASNHAFTPFTTPSSKPQLGGGLPVFITDVTKLPDGRVTFCVGYESY